MYTGKHALLRPLQPAFIMAATGETVTYRELEARSNRLAHLFRNRGLKRLDHYSIFMENNSRYFEACAAGERSGLYYTCVNSYLTAGELAYILTNSQSRILVTSKAKLDVAREALKECPKVELCIIADGDGESDRIVGLQQATSGLPAGASWNRPRSRRRDSERQRRTGDCRQRHPGSPPAATWSRHCGRCAYGAERRPSRRPTAGLFWGRRPNPPDSPRSRRRP